MANTKTVGDQPAVCVVIPVRNELECLHDLVADVLGQDYSALQEVYFVDGQSDDGTYEALGELTGYDPRVRILKNSRRSTASSINLGFRSTQCDVVMRMDAHARYSKDVVRRCVDALITTGAGGVGTCAVPDSPKTLMGLAIQAAHESPIGFGVASFRRLGQGGWADTIWNGCYWRSVVESVGGLREDMWRAEDNDFNKRVRDQGFKLFIVPNARTLYRTRPNLRALCTQCFNNGRAVVASFTKNPLAFRFRHFAPLALVLISLLSLFAAAFWDDGEYALGALALFYTSILAYGSLWAARRKRGWYLVLLPVVIASVHLSYGFGSVWQAVALLNWSRTNTD